MICERHGLMKSSNVSFVCFFMKLWKFQPVNFQVRQFIWLKKSLMSPNARILIQNLKSKPRLLSSAEAQSQINVWFDCFARLGRPQKQHHCKKKNQDIRQTSFPRDSEIEWEHALAVTHYYWLTGVIEFCLENIQFIYDKSFLVKM